MPLTAMGGMAFKAALILRVFRVPRTEILGQVTLHADRRGRAVEQSWNR